MTTEKVTLSIYIDKKLRLRCIREASKRSLKEERKVSVNEIIIEAIEKNVPKK